MRWLRGRGMQKGKSRKDDGEGWKWAGPTTSPTSYSESQIPRPVLVLLGPPGEAQAPLQAVLLRKSSYPPSVSLGPTDTLE